MKVSVLFVLFLPFYLTYGSEPQTILLRGSNLLEYKKLIKKDDVYERAWKKLRYKCDSLIGNPTYTVISKTLTPESGDKRDYMSFGPYWWPDPKKENGLPYIRKDGKRNPAAEDERSDSRKLTRLIGELKVLSVGYYLSKDEKFAERGAKLVNTWFLDPETKMNPNLNFGQAIPGKTKGRGIGIIETRHLGRIVDALILFKNSRYFKKGKIFENTKLWFKQYLDWLLTSKNGIDESKTVNNHGTWYDVQVAILGIFCDRSDLVEEIMIRVRDDRLEQIKPDGSQPYELKRTRSLEYSAMNLEAFLTLAKLSEYTSIDLWSAHDQKILKAALFIVNFTDKKWPYKDISNFEYDDLFGAMKLAAPYSNQKINDFVERIKSKVGRDLLLY